jgi:hypothetical protein
MPRLRTRIVPRPGTTADLTAPTPPAQGPPEPVGTTSVSLTYTHPGAPAGTTYTLSVTDQSTGSAITPSSGSGLGPYVIPTSDGLRAVHRMVASAGGQTSRSDVGIIAVEQDVADAYPVEGSAGWREVWECDLTAETTQGPIPAGASTITLSGDTITTRGAVVPGGGTFGVNNTCSVTNGQGLVLEVTATGTISPEVTLTLPLGETLTADHALRVSVKVKVFNEDSSDSAWVYVADSAVTPTFDVSSASDVAGFRITGQTASLTYRRGASPSSAVTVPAGWSNGTTIYAEFIVPGYGNDAVIRLDDSQFLNPTPDQRGRSQSAAAAPTTTATAWAEGLSSVKLLLGMSTGGVGTGTPKAVLEYVLIEVR